VTSLISTARINHLEVTLAPGTLRVTMGDLQAFYCDTLGFRPVHVDAFPSPHVFLTTDQAGSQFIYVAEHPHPMVVDGEDHLGIHVDDRQAVDRLLSACRQLERRDARMQIKPVEDLDLEQTVTHASYFRYLLPIWFDIQVIEFKPGFQPQHRWVYR
jgi:catechol 2,3-dioxygenase-like lactoylglutathione lyase family enzyme